MIVKLTLTTICDAKCITCPSWKSEKNHMPYEDFVKVWNKIIAEERIHKVILNNVGDVYSHPDCVRILKYISRNNKRPPNEIPLFISMITNAAKMDRVPEINELIISFNGGNKKDYEKVTGLDFDIVVNNIRRQYGKLKNAQLHILIFEENKESEKDIKKTWGDFPGKIRVSYKYDNQMKKDLTITKFKSKERIFCDYLDTLCIDWNSNIVMCAHDWKRVNIWGNFITDDFDDIIRQKDRIAKIKEHGAGKFTGVCEKCNYNITQKGKVFILED